jgi:hypothetical protein|tara:strand:- start:1399 stop:2019 length:621 start_codon:yes stop_codon:yes gene_type:complete
MADAKEKVIKGNFVHAEKTLQSAYALRYITNRWDKSEFMEGMLTFQPMYYVMTAFAMELYLKTILRILGQKPHGHKLKLLWEKIPDSYRAEFEEIFVADALPANNHNYDEGLMKMLDPNYKYVAPKMADIFAQYDDYFNFWRYGFEHEYDAQLNNFPFDDRAIQATIRTMRMCIVYFKPEYEDSIIHDNWITALQDGKPPSFKFTK